MYEFNIDSYNVSCKTCTLTLHWKSGSLERSDKFSVTESGVFLFPSLHFNNLKIKTEKAMAPHSSTLAWKIPWTEEPGRLRSMESWRVRHNWVTSLSLFTFMHWRRKWQPTSVFLPGESQGRGSLVGCRLWGHSHRVGHDWSDLAAVAAAAYTRRNTYFKETAAQSVWTREGLT